MHNNYKQMFTVKESCLAVCLVLLAAANAESSGESVSAVANGINNFASSLFGVRERLKILKMKVYALLQYKYLFQSVAQRGIRNFMMSPLSQSVALAAVAYGSGGNTRQQFQQVLGLPEFLTRYRTETNLISVINFS